MPTEISKTTRVKDPGLVADAQRTEQLWVKLGKRALWILPLIAIAVAIWGYAESPAPPGPQRQATQPQAPAPQVAAADDPQCTKIWEDLVIGPSPKRFNPGGACIWRMKSAGACIKVKRAAWTGDAKEYGPYCDKGPSDYTATPDDAERIWTTDGRTMHVLVRLTPAPPGSAQAKRRSVGVEAKVGVGIYRN